MKEQRSYYFLIFLGVIFLGIISRKISFIPLYTGDFLYAVMIYVLVRILLINKKTVLIITLSLLICYSIELLQLYNTDWIIAIRKTLLGKYVLGQGFLWTDLIAYSFGIATVSIFEKFILKKNTT